MVICIVYYYLLQVQITRAKFQFYTLKQQKNACSIENVYSNAELELIQHATVYVYVYSEKI